LTIASGFCPGVELAAQTNTSERAAQTNNTERYEAIVRLFRDTKRPPTPLLGAEAAWTLTLPLAPAAAAVMDDDRIYVPLREKHLVALDRETGRHAWSRLLDVAVPPVAGDGRLFVQNDRMITALDSATGADRWSASLEAAPAAPLAWTAGAVIALLESGDVLAFRSTDGQLMWRRDPWARPLLTLQCRETPTRCFSLWLTVASSRSPGKPATSSGSESCRVR
jgi:outer membrane protein assembly factor BamB